MRMRVLIVDDETLARAYLAEQLGGLAEIEIVGQAANGFEAVKLAEELSPDLMLLDVQMPKLSGFEVLELLADRAPAVVFVTAHDEFALRAFEVHAVDYLMKPVEPQRLIAALERAMRARAQSHSRCQPLRSCPPPRVRPGRPLERVLIREGGRVHVLPIDKIDFVEAQDDYLSFASGGKRQRKQQTMAEIETQLDRSRFVRIHRSFLLNVDRLARIEPYAKDSWLAVLARRNDETPRIAYWIFAPQGVDRLMDDKNVLLDQLRIDRTAVEEDGSTRRWVLIGGSIVLVVALGAGAWWFLSKPTGIPVADADRAGGAEQLVERRRSHRALRCSMHRVTSSRGARRRSHRRSSAASTEVHIEEGQRVKEGEVIAKLDDAITRANLAQARAQVQQAEANLAAAQVALNDAKPIFERNERQMQASVISAQTFDTAKATFNAAKSDFDVRTRALEVARASLALAERNQDDTVVRAPFAGVVTVKAAQAGEIVSPQSAGGGFTRTGIGTIVDMDSLEVEVDVSENFINRVRPDQPATIKLNAYPDWEIPAAVIAVIPTADRSKATVKVRVAFKQKDERVLPEMGARVSFLSSPEAPAAGGAPATAAQAVLVPDGRRAGERRYGRRVHHQWKQHRRTTRGADSGVAHRMGSSCSPAFLPARVS